MAELNGLSIVSAVTKKLRDNLSNKEIAAIYKDRPKQNVIKPYIMVHQINGTHTPELRKRGRRDYIIDVRCHPKDNQDNKISWCSLLAEKLINILETITLLDGTHDVIKARNIEWRVENEVLHVICYYSIKVIKKSEDIPRMNDMSYGSRIK